LILLGNQYRVVKKKVKKTKKQIESCKKIGFNNRKSILKIVLTKTTLWKYCYKNNNTNNILYKKIKPQQSFQDIICILQTFSNTLNNTKTFDKSLFYKVVKGQKLSAYGWDLDFIYL
jgi:biotin synthase-like enzyme